MIFLTSKQQEALPIIEWLFRSDSLGMGTGRTTVLAMYFIERAIKEDKWIAPFDHVMPPMYERARRSIMPAIQNLFDQNYRDKYELLWRLHDHNFRMKERTDVKKIL